MCYLAQKDQYVCQSNQGLAEAVTGVLGSTQFFSRPFYHPRSSRGRFGHPREAAVCAGNFPDSNGISDYCKRQKHSHKPKPLRKNPFAGKLGKNASTLPFFEGARPWSRIFFTTNSPYT